MRPAVPVRVFGGPTVLIEYAGLRLLTDPTFDAPGSYDLGTGLVLTKTAPSAITPDALGPVDAVLLSHDQHPDNLDGAGRAFLPGAPSSAGGRCTAGMGRPATLVPSVWSSIVAK